MAKPGVALIFATFLLSCVSLALILVSIGTTSWVVADTVTIVSDAKSKVNYGLFKGSYERHLMSQPDTYTLHMTCLFDHNVCALSCRDTAKSRENEVEDLYDGNSPSFACRAVKSRSRRDTEEETSDETPKDDERTFINAGVWVSTLLFLAVSVLFSVVSGLVSVLNTATNPVEMFVSIVGLYIYNGVASAANVLVILLWGIHFGLTISKNVAIRDTIVHQWSSDGNTSLGYSYWLLFPAAILHMINIGLLLYRQKLINQQPSTVKVPITENVDGTIFLY